MELTKETLHQFLDERPAISPRALALQAGLNENYINQMYNKSNRGLTSEGKNKLMNVLPLYGWNSSEHST